MNDELKMERIKVLLIEDNPEDARLIKAMLAKETTASFDLEWKDRLSSGLLRLDEGGIDVIILDLMLPDSPSGFYTFTTIQAKVPGVPVVVLTSLADASFAINAVRMGAQDDLIKGQVDSNQLVRSILYSIKRKQTLKNYAAKLKRANRLNDLLTYMMSNDLMNSIIDIKTMTELKLEKVKDEEMRNMLLMIKDNASQLIEMMKSANMYAVLENTEKLVPGSLDVNEIFKKVIDRTKPELEKKDMKLEFLAKGKCHAMVNPMIEDVFSNLVINAVKYSPVGGKVEANITNENGHCRIYLKDWGYGVKDEDKEFVFNSFLRVDRDGVRRAEPTLAIVKRIVELHGGKVWVEDNPEGGSVFNVEIPKISGE